MRHKSTLFSRILLALLILAQPLLPIGLTSMAPLSAQAADSTANNYIGQAQAANGLVDAAGSSLLPGSAQPIDPIEQADTSDDAAFSAINPDYTPASLSQVQAAFFGGDFSLPKSDTGSAKPTVPNTVLNAPAPVQLSAADTQKLNDFQVDTRLTQYLNYLVAPAPLGAGLGHVKANIYKGYDTRGIGKYDRQTLDANLEDPSQISPHNAGQAVDITEVGAVTCKLVEHRIIGGHTTHWQAALPVKVAWQSPSGIANNPVPTSDSLVGAAGTMSASGILNYLNSTGEMDAYVDYVKGLNISQIAEYVGVNILMKNLGSAQVQFDPLASSVMAALGNSTLLKQLPGLPPGINGGTETEDVRINAAKAQIEDGLGLPTGSLRGYGWSELLRNTGARQLEQSLNLPTNYLDSHSLQDLTTSDITKAAFSYVARSDDALNFIPGTVAALQNGDQNGLKMAAVNILSKGFKLSEDQKKALIAAVSKGQNPNLDPLTLNTGSQLSVDGLKSYLAGNAAEQRAAQAELKKIGLSLFEKAVKEAVPSKFSGLTSQLLNQLLNPGATISQKVLTNQLGAILLASAADVDPNAVSGFIANPSNGQTATLIASGLNSLFDLTGTSVLKASDVTSLFTNNFDAIKKLGGAEIDRAFHWQAGTGLGVINDPNKLTEAIKETFANNIGALLGINGDIFSLGPDASKNYGLSLIKQRFGLSGFNGDTTAVALLTQIGGSKFKDIFGLLNLNPPNWDDQKLNETWTENDILLGVPTGTTKSYLQGSIDGTAYALAAGDSGLSSIPPDQFFNQFGLIGDYLPNSSEGGQKADLKTIIDYLKTGQNPNAALGLITKIIGRSIEVKANFSVDDFTKFISSSSDAERTKILLDTGLKLFGRAIGADLTNYTDEQIDGLMAQVKGLFNSSSNLLQPGNPLYNQLAEPTVRFFVQATGIPQEFTADAKTFLSGDYKAGLSSLSFVLWQKNINPYLPAQDQLTYQELRDTLGIIDDAAIQKEADLLFAATDESGNPVSIQHDQATLDMARQELNKIASQHVQYKMSDAFLRKIDPTIPVGFTETMFTGSDTERAQTLENFAFSNLDTILIKINPAYVPGTLQRFYTGELDPSQAALSIVGIRGDSNILNSVIAQSGLTLGPLNSTDVANLVNYFAAPKIGQNFLTDVTYDSTWGNFDRWLSSTVGLATLPNGISKSIFYASENNWDFNAELKNAQGTTVIASVNSLVTDFATVKLTSWADKQLHMPAGSVYQLYTAGKAVVAASAALHAAQLTGAENAIASARAGLSQAQASLTVLAITTALQVCAACQQFFSSVDAALHAPPGFTNAAVAGAIAAAFHLGYMGLYVAAAIYLFGVNSTSYECPQPPVDQFALTSFDQGNEQLSAGYTPGVDGPAPPSPNPAPGQNPFDWDDTVPFTSANNQTWEGWARYFTGALLDASLTYGSQVADFNKPLQILTYRQANVEYFAPRAEEGFGSAEADNPRVGMGFTQGSTNTTDYVYVSFGGYF